MMEWTQESTLTTRAESQNLGGEGIALAEQWTHRSACWQDLLASHRPGALRRCFWRGVAHCLPLCPTKACSGKSTLEPGNVTFSLQCPLLMKHSIMSSGHREISQHHQQAMKLDFITKRQWTDNSMLTPVKSNPTPVLHWQPPMQLCMTRENNTNNKNQTDRSH